MAVFGRLRMPVARRGGTEWLNYEPLGPAELRQMTKLELAGCVLLGLVAAGLLVPSRR